MKKGNYIGDEYGELTVIEFVGAVKGSGVYKCKCTCGNTKEFFLSNLRMGRTKSCGCRRDESVSKKLRKHGDRHTRLYQIWTNIKSRCTNPNTSSYKYYGDKGIGISDEWKDDYSKFKEWSLENGYDEKMTIDRVDNNGGYYPDNCRWTDRITQSRNRDCAWYITIDGITKHAKDWCKEYGVNYKTAHNRLSYGWSDVDAVTVSKGEKRHAGT
jgi:hypothetical protein